MDDDNFAKWAVSLIVVHTNLHFEGGERGEGLVSVLVHGGVGRSHHLLLPASGPVGTERNDVAETLTVLELFGYRLETRRRKNPSPKSVFH